jgi:Domain of unknown function (DUF4832)/Domain of unknown function (DUF4874)
LYLIISVIPKKIVMRKEDKRFTCRMILFLLFNILFADCGKKPGNTDVDLPVVAGNTTVSYLEDQTNFSNPERGFYSEILSESSAPSSLTQAFFDQLKRNDITLIRRLYSMVTFRSGPISAAYLQHIQDDMDMVRNNGCKVILRFSYTNNEPEPWNDAPRNIILTQIDQLTNILQRNVDVIAMMEAGFIGRWGEWHDSSNGLANPADMKIVLFKLLDALPKSRDVVVRYQQAKKDIFGINEPIGDAEAFNESNRSRTGHHNDCFLAADEDWGTYWPNDPLSLAAQKEYLSQENKYLPQQGETCNCNSPRSDCTVAVKELAQMRWSALNREYIECVLNSWKTQGCYDEISKRLGYRFRLLTAELPKIVKTDAPLSLNIVLKNDGFASPYNARDMELVLRSKSTATVTRIKLLQDPRTWLPDRATIKINENVMIPASLLPGEYDLLLNFPDPEITLNTKPAYSIRLANQNVWESTTGFNSLQAAVTIVKQ